MRPPSGLCEVGHVKPLPISNCVTATGTVQNSAGRGAKRPTYHIPHREGLKQMFGDMAVDALTPRCAETEFAGAGAGGGGGHLQNLRNLIIMLA
jgi:hypothetical protein